MNKKIIISIILVLISYCLLYYFTANHYKSDIKEYKEEIISLKKERNKLKSVSKIEDINELKKENEGLHLLLEDNQKEIDKLNEIILGKNLDTSEFDLEKYNLLVEENELMKKEYDKLKQEYELISGSNIVEEIPNTNIDSQKEEVKRAYLTFDDGPSINTIKILDILKKENIKATFFVNGKEDDDSKAIYQRIINEGHVIANHTYSHDYATIYKSVENFEKDFNKLNTLLSNLGVENNYILRYPGGSNNEVSHKYGGKDIMYKIAKHMQSKGYVFFDWNVDSGDASASLVNTSTLINNIKNGVKNKNEAIILMHDTKAKTTTPEALPEIIKHLKTEGYTFEVLKKDGYTKQFITIN